MRRDYVRNAPRKSRKSSGSSGIVWLFMGILIGLVIAGVFYVKNQTHLKTLITPSHQKTSTTVSSEPAKTSAKTPSPQSLQTQFDFYNVLPSQKVTGPSGEEAPVEAPHQETGNALNSTSSKQEVTALPPPVTPQAPAPENPAPVVVPAPAKIKDQVSPAPVVQPPPATKHNPASTPKRIPPPFQPVTPTIVKPATYTVQVATFNNVTQADRLRAQLTLMGFEVKVNSATKNGKTLHRVWLGSYTSLHEAESVQKQLQENKISSKVLKSGT